MKKIVLFLLFLTIKPFPLILILLSAFTSCKKTDQIDRFPLAAQHNINGALLSLAFDEIKKVDGILSLIVCRDGEIIADEYSYYRSYGPDSIKNIMSVTKSFIGVLVGIAIDKGYIESVYDPISKYLGSIMTFPDPVKAGITIDQLLKMSAGHKWNGTSPESLYNECFSSVDELQFIINLPLIDTPGTIFNYSDGASHLLSIIISEATSCNTEDFAKNYLFDPLRISNFWWQKDTRGYPIGASGLKIIPHDMVKFGNLILNKGIYEGKQIVSENWITKMTSAKISTNNDVLYGPEYGYQIWLGNSEGYKYYMAMGWGGQFIFILPDHNCVITATCWTTDLDWQQAGKHWTEIIRIIVEKIFPAIE